MSEFTLFNYRRCPFCIRVRMVFLWKGIEFNVDDEDLRNRSESLKGFYGEKRATVPLLLHKGKPVFESLDIMEYLEGLFPSLSVTDFRKWGGWSALELRDAIQLYKYAKGSEKEEGEKQVMDCFALLEQSLHPFLNGKEVSLADFAVWPFVRQALRVKPSSITLSPKLEKWFETLEDFEQFKDLMKK